MKTVSNNFKTVLTNFGREYKNKISVYDYDVLATENNDYLISEDGNDLIAKVSNSDFEIVLNDEDLFSIKIITKGQILSTLMKELDFETTENLDIGRVITYDFGLKLPNDTYEYINYGKYIIYDKEYDEATHTYTYTCYDYMLKTMRTIGNEFIYSSNNINGVQLLEKTCDILSIDFDNSLTDNNNKPTPFGIMKHKTQEINIGILLENNLTYRDLLNLICKYFGVSMYMQGNNLIIKLLGEITYNQTKQEWYVDNENPTIVTTINEDYLRDSNVIFKNTYGPINSLELTGIDESKQQYISDYENISTNGETKYSIKNNLLLNNSNTWDNYGYAIATDIFNLIKGTTYELNDIKTNGVLFLEWLDYYYISVNDVNYRCLLLNDEIIIRSGIQETIYTEMPEETEEEYTSTNTTTDDIIANSVRARGNCYATNFEASGRINATSVGPDLEREIKRISQGGGGGGTTGGEVLPVGSEIEFNGQASAIPTGWEQTDDPYVYSTTEKKIGVYTDGKPIYRKTLSGTYTTNNTRVVIDFVSNVAKIVNSYGVYSPNTLSPVNAFGQPMINTVGGIDAYSQARINNSNVAQICFSTPQSVYQGLTGSYEVTIEYTKTTD